MKIDLKHGVMGLLLGGIDVWNNHDGVRWSKYTNFKTNSIDWWTMKVEHAINLIDERGIYVSRNFDFYIYGLVKWQCELNFSFYKYIPISTYLVLRIVFAIP